MGNKRKYVILLTACVNPGGMPYTVLTDKSVRLQQYRAALDFYLSQTSLPVVFCENTLCDFSADYQQYIDSGQLEYITFDGNSFDHSKGKGYGEALIMEEAFSRSEQLQHCDIVIKITGRLIVKNISQLVTDNSRMLTPTIQTFYPQNGVIDSRLVFMPFLFCTADFLAGKSAINDYMGYYFEHLLFDSLISRRHYVYMPFLHVPLIAGVSGTSGKTYVSDLVDGCNHRFAFHMLGNALRMDNANSHFSIPLHIRIAIMAIRLYLYLILKMKSYT